jgi:hypothetical protein
MPKPKEGESKEEFISRFMESEEAKTDYPGEDQRYAVAESIWREYSKKGKEVRQHLTISQITVKGDYTQSEPTVRPNKDLSQMSEAAEEEAESGEKVYTALVATTHPDREGDMLSVEAIKQIVEYINKDSVGSIKSGGSYRSISLFHDWINEGDATLDEVAFVLPGSARTVTLSDGHYGCEVDFKINKYYRGEYTPEEISYRIENGNIAGLSIEYKVSDEDIVQVTGNDGSIYNFVKRIKDYAGQALARARLIANPAAVIYKEIETKVKNSDKSQADQAIGKEGQDKMGEEDKPENTEADVTQSELEETLETENTEENVTKEIEGDDNEEEQENNSEEESIEQKQIKKDDIKVKEILESKEFKQAIEEIKLQNKVINQKEEDKMDVTQLKIKEMNECLKGKDQDILSFKEHASDLLSTKEAENAFLNGVRFGKPTLKVKTDGTKLRVVGDIKTKDTLDTSSNTEGTYGMNIVEFNDVFVPGLIETFNQRTDTFDILQKKDNLAGTNNYGWRITTDQETDFAVDPDDPTVTKVVSGKEKLQTNMKVYRKGVSVTDYMREFSRAAIGDLLQLEANKQMADMRKALNRDLFTAQTDSGNKILGYPAVADAATYTTLYGKSRTTANRLKRGTAANSYEDISGPLTTARLREALSDMEIDGAMRGDLIIVCAPAIRDDIFELQDGQQQLFEKPAFGFEGAIRFDGVPVLPDSDVASDSLFVIDRASSYIVIGKPPQMTGLAKVGAAEEAYVETYLAHVYEQPRRIVWLDGLS